MVTSIPKKKKNIVLLILHCQHQFEIAKKTIIFLNWVFYVYL